MTAEDEAATTAGRQIEPARIDRFGASEVHAHLSGEVAALDAVAALAGG
jgi:hypothetical protein